MTTSGSDAAETMVRMALSGAEVSVKLTASAAKNLLAITIALARNHKKLYGKTKLRRMLKETRDIRVFPMSAEQYHRFQKHAKRHKILYAAVRDRSGRGGAVDLILPAKELERANLVFERIRYGQDAAPDHTPSRDRSRERQPEKADDPKNVSRLAQPDKEVIRIALQGRLSRRRGICASGSVFSYIRLFRQRQL